jgi:hypothetical protein
MPLCSDGHGHQRFCPCLRCSSIYVGAPFHSHFLLDARPIFISLIVIGLSRVTLGTYCILIDARVGKKVDWRDLHPSSFVFADCAAHTVGAVPIVGSVHTLPCFTRGTRTETTKVFHMSCAGGGVI